MARIRKQCEICETHFSHPTITEGQQDARATFWIRPIGGEWIRTLCRSFSTLRREWRVNQLKNYVTEVAVQ